MRRLVVSTALVLATVTSGAAGAVAATAATPAAHPQGGCPIYPALSYNNGHYWVGVGCNHVEVP